MANTTDALIREIDRLKKELQQERDVRGEDTCAYCLAPLGPPSGIEDGAQRAKAHALTCESHPMREVVRQRDELLEALEKAVQLASIARDWNLYEVEIDKKMVGVLELEESFRAAIKKARGEG